jgi:hypothetical protein
MLAAATLDTRSSAWRLMRRIRCGPNEETMDTKSLIIGVLLVAVCVLGYMVYDANRNKVKIDLPGIKIEGR